MWLPHVYGGVTMHVRTCTPHFYISGTAEPIALRFGMYRVFQNYLNIYFSTIISTALKPLKMWIPKFSEILIKRQS